MKQLICLFLLLELVMTPVRAQRPSWTKLSPMVREACLLSRSPFRRIIGRCDRIIAFIRADDVASAVNDVGGHVLLRYGDLAIANLPVNQLAALSNKRGVRRIEAKRGIRTLMDTTRQVLHIDAVNEGLNLPQGYTGQGVVVGVQDIGFDLTHPTFYSTDMRRYRIQALWDMLSTDTLSSTLPVGRDYVGQEALLAVGHPRDGFIQTHGTHTAGIAAGSGAEGDGTISSYVGAAPDADLCLVNNATTDDISLIDSADYYKYTFALDALGFKYIFDYADRQGKPCVINFSEGSQQDFYGYDQLYYAMLDSLTGPGHIIVSSAGNDGGSINYVNKPQGVDSVTVKAYGSGLLSFTTHTSSPFTLSATVTTDRLHTATLTVPLDSIIASPDSTLQQVVAIGTDSVALTVTAYPDCYNAASIVADWLFTPAKGKSVSSTLHLVGTDAEVSLFPVNASLIKDDSRDNQNALCVIDNSHSVNSPSSAPSVISVGATGYRTSFVNYLGDIHVYDTAEHGLRGTFSSVGPTFDGRIKPDVMAPGQNIISAYSSWYLEHNPNASDIGSDVRHFTYNGRTYVWNANSGTSMSAPVVTGVIALWLQANPRLTPKDCLDIFARTCVRPDHSLTYPNNYYGYGEIDAAAGIEAAIAMTGIKNLEVTQRTDNSLVYTLDGRCVGNSLTGLPSGIYIKNHKKIIIR